MNIDDVLKEGEEKYKKTKEYLDNLSEGQRTELKKLSLNYLVKSKNC